MVKNSDNLSKSDAFTVALVARMQHTNVKGEFFAHTVTVDSKENRVRVSNIPQKFLFEHSIPIEPNGRKYFCTTYGTLYAYAVEYNLGGFPVLLDHGVRFNEVHWRWEAF